MDWGHGPINVYSAYTGFTKDIEVPLNPSVTVNATDKVIRKVMQMFQGCILAITHLFPFPAHDTYPLAIPETQT